MIFKFFKIIKYTIFYKLKGYLFKFLIKNKQLFFTIFININNILFLIIFKNNFRIFINFSILIMFSSFRTMNEILPAENGYGAVTIN